MNFTDCFNSSPVLLMEGAIGERLKREFGMPIDGIAGLSDFIYNEKGKSAIQRIYHEYISIAEKYDLPFMATTTTRRANHERIIKGGYNENIIYENVALMKSLRRSTNISMYIGGLLGCKGDAYSASDTLSIEEAFQFHTWSANLFKASGVDFLFAAIMPAIPEAIGMARALESTELPYIISFMIRKDGKLIDGTTIHDAIAAIDKHTSRNPLCYMVNCVHPKNLKMALSQSFNKTELVKERFRGIQANTSCLSPEELNDSDELITSNAVTLACEMIDLYDYFDPKIFGGCCGTDNSHIEEIAKRIKEHTNR